MLNNKLINFFWIFWCCALYKNVVAREIVSNNTVTVQTFFHEGTMFVEGRSVNSSYIKSLTADLTISKMYVYVANTFYADEDLELHGIEELQIFAHTWMVDRPVTFDLSGWNGTNHDPTIFKGSAGNSGNSGMDGGSFLGLAHKVINCEYLTVISNGGNGGDGQDGTASDDVYALFSGDDGIGESGWFSQVDFHKYYEKYFGDKGYNVEISDIDDSTSLYAVFVHNKKASFNIRLHPRKCCGTTGIGGAGGIGGRNGTLIFKYVGNSYVNNTPVSTPALIANHGTVGKLGKDAKTCETLALDVRADTELERIVFFYPPLHQSFTSHFTVLNHTNSSKCSPEYTKSSQSVVLDSTPTEIKIDASVNRYKRFLLENTKNDSLSAIIMETYKAIDDSWNINDEYSLEALILEAFELEINCLELRKSVDVIPLYERLADRINRYKSKRRNNEVKQVKSSLKSLLWYKLSDLREDYGLIVNLTSYIEVAVSQIEFRNDRISTKLNVSDEALLNSYNQLKFGVDGNYFLATYNYVIEGFKLTYFPFAAQYLEMYELPASFLDYEDLSAISWSTTFNLKKLSKSIGYVYSNNHGNVMYQTGFDKTLSHYAFFTWKNSDIRDKIRDLFAGKKITLLADVRQAKRNFNALKFNTLDLVFRSSDQTITDRLNYALEAFELNLNHTGQSAIRCNNKIYEMTSDSVYISSSFLKDESQVPLSRNLVYEMLRDNRASLSPYALWEFQLEELGRFSHNFYKLEPYAELVDIVLYGTGQYLVEDASVCEHEDLAKFYSQIKN